MQTIKKILVDIDPDKQDQPALSKALHFAKQQPITIKLLSCLYYPSVLASHFLTPKQREKTQAVIIQINQLRLNKLITQHSQKNVTYETEVIWHFRTSTCGRLHEPCFINERSATSMEGSPFNVEGYAQ